MNAKCLVKLPGIGAVTPAGATTFDGMRGANQTTINSGNYEISRTQICGPSNSPPQAIRTEVTLVDPVTNVIMGIIGTQIMGKIPFELSQCETITLDLAAGERVVEISISNSTTEIDYI